MDVVSELSFDTNIYQNNFKTFLAEGLLSFKQQETQKIIQNLFNIEKRQAFYTSLSVTISQSFVFITLISLSIVQTIFGSSFNSSFLVDLVVIQKILSAIANFQSKRASASIKIPSYDACNQIFKNNVFRDINPFERKTNAITVNSIHPTGISVRNGSFTIFNKLYNQEYQR